jgi:uncharacterized protein YndB with AHSA1/START domain
LALILLFVLIGTLLPHGYEVTSNVTINQPPEKVFPLINRLRDWSQWSQWRSTKDAPFEIEYGGSKEGVGAAQTWTEARGTGKLWIVKSEPDRQVEYVIEFANFPRMTSVMSLEPSGNGTVVRWSSTGKLPAGPFYGWLRLVFVRGLKVQYDVALLQLKEVAEGRPRPDDADSK